MTWAKRCESGAPLWPFVGPGGLTLRDFSPSDPPRIAARADFVAEHEAAGSPLFGPDRPEGRTWTLTDGATRWARPIACGGLEPLGHGRWSGWIYAADLSPRGWAMVRAAFRSLVVEVKARRVEIAVRGSVGPEFGRAAAFAVGLGLSHEGVMKAWGPDGSNWHLYGGVF